MWPLSIILADYPYNLSNLSQVQDVGGFFVEINNVSHGSFGWLTIASVFMLSFILTNRYKSTDAFIVSSFITWIVAFLFSLAGIVNGTVAIITMFLFAFSIIVSVLKA